MSGNTAPVSSCEPKGIGKRVEVRPSVEGLAACVVPSTHQDFVLVVG